MYDIKNKKILVLAPHTDDGELGCGGTINKLIENDNELYYAAFSACQQSVLKEFPSDILITEVKKATSVLGVKPENLLLFDYEVRTFGYHRQQILDEIIKLRSTIQPDIVFMPAIHDIHQDHYTVSQEGLRAFKNSSIICYELPWNNINFSTQGFVTLSESNVKAKVNALKEYKSQAHRPYANEDFIRSLARTRGVQINTQYAECFEIIRLIW